MEINHALIAVTWGEDVDVHHFCGFAKPPTDEDYNSLMQRLRTDPCYGLVDKDYQIQEASPALVKYYNNLDPKDEDAYYVDETGVVVKM